MLAFLAQLGERIADIRRIGNSLAGNIENDVPGLEAVFRSRTIGVDTGYDDAFAGSPGHIGCRSKGEAELRTARSLAFVRTGLRLTLFGQLTQRHRDGLRLSIAQNAEIDRGAGRHARNPLRELVRVLDRGAVERGDDVAGLDACLRGGAVRLRLRHQRALHRLHAKAVGDVRGHRLDLHAEPTAHDVSLLLELGDDGFRGAGGNVEATAP